VPERAQRLIEAAKRPLPEGTFVVGIGLLISGLTAYGFQIIAQRALTKPEYTALNGLWVVAFILAPGFFLPLEQEVGRAIADRRVRGLGGGPVVKRAAIAGALLVSSLIALTLLAQGVLGAASNTDISDIVFHGKGVLLPCLLIALVTYSCEHLTRGTLSGNGRFGPYGLILAAEGIIRVVPCAVLYASGVNDIFWYGLAFSVPPLAASAIAVRGQRGLLEPGPEAPWSELSVNLGWLFGGSVLAQALSYSPVLAVILFAENAGQRTRAADFIAGFFIARIPILLFQAVQAALLPKLARLAAAGQHADFRNGLRKLLGVVIAIGILGVIGGATLGPTVGDILFKNFDLGRRDLALLAAGSALFVLALTLAQALIALMGHARATWCWLLGNVVFWVVAAASTDNLFLRGELGFVAGGAAAMVCMAWQLLKQIRVGLTDESLAHLVEQIEHEPLEI